MHIHVHLDRHDPSNNRLELDGVDVTKSVLSRGFKIDMEKLDDATMAIPHVHVIFKPDTLAVDGDVLIDTRPAEPVIVNDPEGE